MKAYTDTEQSKKLVEILPGESADMSYVLNLDTWEYYVDLGRFSQWIVPKYAETKMPRILPCWSLAALLEILPEETTDDNGYKTYIDIRKYDSKYQIAYYTDLNWSDKITTDEYESLVDACVEMVVKLHEQKLI